LLSIATHFHEMGFPFRTIWPDVDEWVASAGS
jgi:hypothetical protein